MELTIETVTDLDGAWPELEPLLYELHDYHRPLVGVELLDDWAQRQRALIAASIEALGDAALVLIARNEADAIAFTNAHISRNEAIFEEQFAAIDNMCVTANARREGVGSQLLAAVESWSRARGVPELRLGVAAANEAGVAFWRARGFDEHMLRMAKALP